MKNSVIIASNADFLADSLREILKDISFQVFIAATDNELANKIKDVYPRYIFLEHCFHSYGTDIFIKQIAKRNLRIVVWTASEIKPLAATRYIAAGADSFFTLRDTYKNIWNILNMIAQGKQYFPADVEELFDRENAYPVIGRALTNRQLEIAKLIISGKSNAEIGKILSLSVNTIKFHKKRIYQKYSINTAVDILRNGVISGVLNMDDLK